MVKPLSGLGVGFRVFARAVNGVEEEIGTLAWNNPRIARGTFLTSNFEPRDGPFDIILRADREAAVETTDVFEIWDGQLVFEDVPVKPRQ